MGRESQNFNISFGGVVGLYIKCEYKKKNHRSHKSSTKKFERDKNPR